MKYLMKILDLVYPKRCPLCHKILLPRSLNACHDCVQKLPLIREPRCKKCSKPLDIMEQEYCYDCQVSKASYDKGYAVFLYEGAIKQSLMEFKYKGQKQYAQFYTDQIELHLKRRLEELHVDFLVPIPLHNERLRIRGYNQAELLAKGLSKSLNVPINTHIIYRNRDTIPQKLLDSKGRFHNLMKAFSIYEDALVEGTRILLVDDIYTTGSTIKACATLLQKAGCANIFFVTICIGNGF